MTNRIDDFSKEVSSKFVEHLQKGDIPMRRDTITPTSFNPATGKEFRGANQLILEMKSMDKGYSDPRWMTSKQVREAGGYIKEREHHTKLEFWTNQRREPIHDEHGEVKRDEEGKMMFSVHELEKPEAYYIQVFNAEQCGGLEATLAPQQKKMPFEKAEEIIEGFGVERVDGRQMAYAKDRDTLTFPDQNSFKTQEEYYASALYELGRATGHPDRMARDDYVRGSKEHSSEELRNELSSYFISKDTGIKYNPVKNAAHVKNWIETINENPREIFHAARDGLLIKKYLLEPDERENLHEVGKEQARRRHATPTQAPKLAPAKEFASLLKASGLEVDSIVSDGKWHNTEKGAYRCHLSGKANGYVKNTETGLSIHWQAQGREMTGKDIARLQAETMNRKENMAREFEAKREHGGKKAYAVMKDMDVATPGQHPYLKENPKDAIKINPENGKLYVPVNDRWGKTQSYQTFDKEGNERSMKDGIVKGGMLRLGDRDSFKDKPVVITPSFKDAQDIREKTGAPTIVAFTNGNMASAVEAIREQYPDKELVFAVSKEEQSKMSERQKGELSSLVEKTGAKVAEPAKVKSALRKGPEIEIIHVR